MEGLKPIPGTAKPGGEPSYKKPKLPPKSDIVAYYSRIAPQLLKHAAGRPLNLLRCPAGYCVYQRNRNHPPSGDLFGPPIRFLSIVQKNGRTEDYLYVEDQAGVIACAVADAIEFHGWGSLAADIERPDRMSLDLDPGDDVTFAEVAAAARTMHQLLETIGLTSFPLLSGGKGIHLVVPLTPAADWVEVRHFAEALCTVVAREMPALFTVALGKSARSGRIFLDWLRNQRTATAILPYSLRARPGAPVAAPIGWDELAGLNRSATFSLADADLLMRRARTLRGWGSAKQRLPSLS